MSILYPSCYRLYDFKAATIKPFKIVHLTQIVAVLSNNDLKLMFNLFDDVHSVKTGNLTLADFEFLLYYQWFNTFKKPLEITWTSKYGNDNIAKVEMSDFKIKRLETLDLTDYTNFVVPRAEEMLLLNGELKPEVKWVYDRIQYLPGNSIADKVATFADGDPSVLDTIRKFIKATNHGLDKTISRTDEKFDSAKYLFSLYEDRNRLKFHLQHTNDLVVYGNVADGLYTLDQEISNLEILTGRKQVEFNKPVKTYPEAEMLTIDLDLTDYVE